MNFVTFIPRKAHVLMAIKHPQTKETDDQLEEAGIETLTYDTQWREYRVRIESSFDEKQRGVLLGLVRKASERRGKPA